MRILGLLLIFPLWATAAAPLHYPRITSIRGKGGTVWTGHGEVSFAAKESLPLIEKARFETGPEGEIYIDIDAHRSVILMASSELNIPGIRPEDGAVPVVILKSGRARLTSTTSDRECQFVSDFFELRPVVGDFVFHVQRKPPMAEVQVLSGEIEFSATNAEDSVVVKPGFRAVFEGALEDGEIAYDLLLKGKKIPRGRLKPPEKVSDSELKSYDEKKHQIEKAHREEIARKSRQKAAEDKAGYVCVNPKGKYNDCSYICDGNPKKAKKCLLDHAGVQCLRRRCNANGTWAEPTVLPLGEAQALCEINPVVSRCP